MLDARRKLDGYFLGSNDREAAVAALEKIEKRPWFELMYLPKAAEVPMDPQKSSWRGQMDLDPFATVEHITIPVLFILGSEDPWIPVRQTAERLRDAAKTHSNLQYVVVPDANHLMMTPPANERMNDADPRQVALETPQSAAYFMLLATWLKTVTA
jgi:pimeloyl-ACP methyl ester carboxylesterase